jgi:hypothetical protein
LREWLSELLSNSPLPQLSAHLLRSVPGLPPILQTVHLLGLAVLMGSIVMICLRVLELAARRQDQEEMLKRLFPWFFWSLPVMLGSALPFLFARPQRYLNNPVFDIKMLALLLALALSLALWHLHRSQRMRSLQWQARLLAAAGLGTWLLTAMAGRWIAYADYIFWPG